MPITATKRGQFRCLLTFLLRPVNAHVTVMADLGQAVMGQPAARLTDLHTCPMVTGTVPHVGGPVTGPGAPTVLVGGVPAARVTDMLACTGPPDVIAKGSASVFINGLPAARQGDPTAHGGIVSTGFATVLIGDRTGGGGGAGSGAAGSAAAAGFEDLLSTGPALTAPMAQARTLVQAAKRGAAFCPRCLEAKRAALG